MKNFALELCIWFVNLLTLFLFTLLVILVLHGKLSQTRSDIPTTGSFFLECPLSYEYNLFLLACYLYPLRYKGELKLCKNQNGYPSSDFQ